MNQYETTIVFGPTRISFLGVVLHVAKPHRYEEGREAPIGAITGGFTGSQHRRPCGNNRTGMCTCPWPRRCPSSAVERGE